MASNTGPNVGFLAILQDTSGTLGGYLATNSWGRPLEFRLTSAVQPNRVQSILYGSSLPDFVASDLIGKTLVEKSTSPVRWIITDSPHALDLRTHVDFPVVLHSASGADGLVSVGGNLFLASRHADDTELIADLRSQSPSLDLGEPFQRIREAVAEARKLSSTQRAA